MRNKVTISKLPKSHRYKFRVFYPDGDTRKTKYFRKLTGEDGAEEWAAGKEDELAEEGSKHAAITEEERNAVIAFRKLITILPEHAQKVSLKDAVESYAKGIADRNRSITCEVIADKLLKRLKSEQKSIRHRDTIESRLKRFNATYGDWLAYDISTEIIDDFLMNLEVAELTQQHYRRALHQMFNHAIKIKATPHNPVKDAMNPKVVSGDIGILSPQEVASLLCHADDNLLPALAISFFAGARREEILKLDWSDIHLSDDEPIIRIRAKVAKSAKTRHIPISKNLQAWLEPLAQPKGNLITSESQYRIGLDKARKAARIEEWPHNAGRHSYASYHLALHKTADKLANSLGHSNSQLLFAHYRKLVTEKEAKTFWAIMPESENNITSISA
ncbi:tyrosine-type recombinase/integrase [Rubritalea sp.]|uniref:tyrosine-type recombinase/integrase n=1 Tax=Rubritalea sp. TaxID=2109375 RepID=UPI003EF511FC